MSDSLLKAKRLEAQNQFGRYLEMAPQAASKLEVEVIVHRLAHLQKWAQIGPQWDTVQAVLGILADLREEAPNDPA